MDFSAVLAGLSVTAAVMAIIGAGLLMAAPDFGRWLTNKVAGFFSGDDEDESPHDEFVEGERYFCDSCGWEMDYDTALASADAGYCYKCAVEFE